MIKQFKPHLACDAEFDKLKFPVLVQRKIDGNRMLIVNSVAVGRSLKAYKNKKLTQTLSHPLLNGFDGEIVSTYENDPDLCRLTTSVVNTIEGGLPNIYKVFDYLTEETKTLGYSQRIEVLINHINNNYDFFTSFPIKIEVPEMWIAHSKEEVEAIYNQALIDNYEGVIIRSMYGKHKDGRCTPKEGNYLRLKPTGDAEGVVVRLEEAYENLNEAKTNELGHTERSTHQENMVPKGMIGALWLQLPDGSEVKVGAGKLNHAERKYYWDNPCEIIGKVVKYAFLATGQKDAPRHPRFIEFLTFRCAEDMSE